MKMDGVIKLQNMPEDASMETMGLRKHQEIADEIYMCTEIFSDVLAGILLSWIRILLDDETYTREFSCFTYQREGGRKKFGFQPVSKEYAPETWKRMREISISIFYRKLRPVIQVTRKAEWRGVFRTAIFVAQKEEKK